MKVTTGGISVGVGALIVGSLSIAAVMTVRDENEGRDDCQPQSFEAARAASEGFQDEYLHPDDDETSAAGAVVMPADDVRDVLEKSTSVPDWTGTGFVVVVDYDPATDSPSPPSCFDETPILYADPERVTG